jgi:beta-glucuronidase
MRKNIFMAAGLLVLALPWLAYPADFSIKDKNGIPYLEQNGMPYFTWFLKTSREELDLAGPWKFKPDPKDIGEQEEFFSPYRNDSDWMKIKIPSDWTKLPELKDYQGAAWYRKTFTPPTEWGKKFNRLEMDGVAHKCKIWINGKLVGGHNGGFTRFSFDVSGLLNYGAENQVTILVDNRRNYTDVPPFLWKNDRLGWWEYGGIAREVKLVSSLPHTVAKLQVGAEPGADGSGDLAVKGLIFSFDKEAAGLIADLVLRDINTGKVLYKETHAPIRIEGHDLASFSFSARVKNIAAWSPENPNLYLLSVVVTGPYGIEENSLEIGFRKFEVRGNQLFLNGKRYYIRGLNRHEDDPETGFYQSDARLDEDMGLLKDLHVNHIRPAHYPNDPRWLALCDRRGITVTEEIPLFQAGTGWEKWLEGLIANAGKAKVGGPTREGMKAIKQIQDPKLIENASQTIAEMIERDRNHPSVIIWSIGNENLTIATSIARNTFQQLYALCKRLDPARPVTFALLIAPVLSPALEKTADIADIISINEYYGWYFGKVEQAGKFFDAVHKNYPNKPVIISEFGADTVYGRRDNSAAPQKLSEEYQVKLIMGTWEQILQRDWISGGMPWSLAEFRCGWWGPDYVGPNMNLKGITDYQRHKKLIYSKLKEFYQDLERAKASQ